MTIRAGMRLFVVMMGLWMLTDSITGTAKYPLVSGAFGLMAISWGAFLADNLNGKKGNVFWILYVTLYVVATFL